MITEFQENRIKIFKILSRYTFNKKDKFGRFCFDLNKNIFVSLNELSTKLKKSIKQTKRLIDAFLNTKENTENKIKFFIHKNKENQFALKHDNNLKQKYLDNLIAFEKENLSSDYVPYTLKEFDLIFREQNKWFNISESTIKRFFA